MFDLPTTVTIKDREFGIRDDGDYRMVLDVFSALQDIDIPKKERMITAIVIFYDGFSLDNVFEKAESSEIMEELATKMFDFISCGQTNMGNKTNHKLIDWEQDEQLIASAVNNVANMEIRTVDYMHWWTFMGHYISVGESVLSTVVQIRSKLVEGKKLEKHEQEFRKKNPEYFIWNRQTVEDREADALIKEIWNQGKEG